MGQQSIRFENGSHAELKLIAKRYNQSVNWVVNRVLAKYLKEEEEQEKPHEWIKDLFE